MKKILILLFMSIFVAGALFYNVPKSSSDELDDITRQIQELTSSLNNSIKATQPLESELKSLQFQIAGLKKRLSSIEADIAGKEKDIEKGYENLAKQEKILNQTIRDFYIKSYYNSPFIVFFSSTSVSDITQMLAYQRAVTDQDKAIITNIALSIKDLETKKTNLESEKKKLAVLKTDLDTQSAKLDEVVTGAKKYQSDLSGKISDLSARQNQIINERSGGFIVSIGDSELADDYNASIKGFREQAPGGYFAVFSFGAHTHRKGMSQYGARGRAQDGQSYRQILSKYYGKDPVGKDTGGDINVTGQGSMNFEDRYLMGIAEMPSTWNMETLKAQAVAARTYAYRYKTQGLSICTNEACQVFSSSKADNPPEAWRSAVQSTRGEVIEDVVTYYSSTTGGYLTTSGWDTTDGSGGTNFTDKTYEKKGGSPWLYKSWYTQGYSTSSNKCGRSNPWLSPQEMADIVNAAIALSTSGIDTSRITPVTTSCWGGNPYSMDELKNLVSANGGISSATSVTVSQGDGSTGNVTINGISISGSDFKRAFNLRAPGYLSIPQSGFAFFNIEKK
ncbi:MAG: SpoIID/LytB domain-containing protein [Patescibacteria group bacterium]